MALMGDKSGGLCHSELQVRLVLGKHGSGACRLCQLTGETMGSSWNGGQQVKGRYVWKRALHRSKIGLWIAWISMCVREEKGRTVSDGCFKKQGEWQEHKDYFECPTCVRSLFKVWVWSFQAAVDRFSMLPYGKGEFKSVTSALADSCSSLWLLKHIHFCSSELAGSTFSNVIFASKWCRFGSRIFWSRQNGEVLQHCSLQCQPSSLASLGPG